MSLRIVNLAAEKSPKAKESVSKDWVAYGEDNNFFEYLIDRYNGSAVNNAIISSVSDQIYGEGLSCTDSDKKPLDHAKMMTIFKANDLKRVAHDLKLLGQGAFNVVWNKGRTQILKAKHIPMQNLRPEKAIEGEIKAYYYSDDWSQYRKERYAPRRIEAFTGARGEESQIMVIKPYAAGYFYFSPVDYAGALQWAEIDEEIGTYHLTNIQNGFAPTMMINFNNGQPTEDEQNHIERKVTQKLEGAKGKKWLISFNDDTTNATTIESLPISEASEQYKFLSEEATRKILIGHKVTSPILFGIKDNTGLGNNAEEIKTAEHGCSLDGVLKKRTDSLTGILNGVDYSEWKTSDNPWLPISYKASSLGFKTRMKKKLQKEIGLPETNDVPLYANIGRIVEQKGMDILIPALKELLYSGAPFQFVQIGTGDPVYEERLLALREEFPDKISVHIKYDHGMAHRIEAGSDFFIMPSRFEPCGLNQLYSLRYGTIPIVRATGGLDDSVTDISEDLEEANGFKFTTYSKDGLLHSIRQSLLLFDDRYLFTKFRKKGMAKDFSLNVTAQSYLEVYDKCLNKLAQS